MRDLLRTEALIRRVIEDASGVERDGESAKSKRYEWVMSTPAVDRAEDIVAPFWNLREFKANPVILYGHDHRALIGRAVPSSVKVDENGQLVGEIEFDEHETNPLALRVAHQVEAGFIKAGSVGFRAGSRTLRHKLDPDDPHFAPEDSRAGWGYVFGSKKQPNTLREFSIVTLGMNQEALRRGADEHADDTALVEATLIDAIRTSPTLRALLREIVSSDHGAGGSPDIDELDAFLNA